MDTIKILLAVVVFAAGLAGGLVPLRQRCVEGTRLLSWGNAFAGGIFLGIGLMHMLGDAAGAWSADLGWKFPIAFLLAGSAFLVLLLAEHVLVLRVGEHGFIHLLEGAHQPKGGTTVGLRTGSLPLETQATTPSETEEGAGANVLTACALIVALSMHSIFAGLALGAQNSIANVLIIFVAIIAHKSTAAFALTVNFVRARLASRLSIGLLTVFCLTTPFGILLGTIISGLLQSRAEIMFDATVTALAAGTFLYIASLDIMREEFLHGEDRLEKWLLAAAAYAGMGVLAIWL